MQALLDAIRKHPADRASILIEHLGGAVSNSARAQGAFPIRSKTFGVLVAAQWNLHEKDPVCKKWVVSTCKRLDPREIGVTYSNYASADDVRAAESFSQQAMQRLVRLKRNLDPHHLLQRNHLSRFVQSLHL